MPGIDISREGIGVSGTDLNPCRIGHAEPHVADSDFRGVERRDGGVGN